MSAVSCASSRRSFRRLAVGRTHARELAGEQDEDDAQVADDRQQQPAQPLGAAGAAARCVQRPDAFGCLLTVDQVAQRLRQACKLRRLHGDAALLQSVQNIRGESFRIGFDFLEQMQSGDQFGFGLDQCRLANAARIFQQVCGWSERGVGTGNRHRPFKPCLKSRRRDCRCLLHATILAAADGDGIGGVLPGDERVVSSNANVQWHGAIETGSCYELSLAPYNRCRADGVYAPTTMRNCDVVVFADSPFGKLVI